MALDSTALTTLEALTSSAGKLLPSDATAAVADPIILSVSSDFQRAAGGRSFHYEAARVDQIRGYGWPTLVLARAPIVSVASVELVDYAGNTVHTYDADDYRIGDAAAGLLEWSAGGGWPWTAGMSVGFGADPRPGSELHTIKVTYAGGWITPWQASVAGGSLGTRNLPYDIERAVQESVATLYYRSHNRLIESSSAGELNFSFARPDGLLTPEASRVARRYRRTW